MGAQYCVIVLDVGKTNKKLFVYDDRLRCLNPDEPAAVFPQVERDGVLADDMASIVDWMLTALGRVARHFKEVRCISMSAHGATIALLGRQSGFPSEPVSALRFPSAAMSPSGSAGGGRFESCRHRAAPPHR